MRVGSRLTLLTDIISRIYMLIGRLTAVHKNIILMQEVSTVQYIYGYIY